MRKSLLTLFILGAIAANVECAQRVRGVAPERSSLYDESKQFSCLDGSGLIPFSQVNDDYCDCRDGSDEPGTAACLNGSFGCENLGYVVVYIPSSRVNDGICDCCDGSDEYSGRTSCPNTCSALAAKMREEEERIRKLKEEGYAKRKELIEAASQLKKTLQDQVQELETKKAELQIERTKLEEQKNVLEQKAKEAKDKQDLIAQEKQREIDAINLAKKIRELFSLIDSNKDSVVQPDELLIYQELDVISDNDGKFTLEEAQKLLDDNPSIDLPKFETTYYYKIEAIIKVPQENKQQEQPPSTTVETPESLDQNVEDSEHQHEHDHDHDHDHEHEHEHEHHHDQYADHEATTPAPDSKYDAETQKLIDEADAARRLYDDTDRNYRDIEHQINDAQRKLGMDTGPNGEYASMIDQCYEYEDREYVYKLCPFEKTVQKSKANSGETIIGNWKSWGDDEKNKYSVMMFDNGLACWNGPQRSTKVIITCGLENKLISVAEPNRCEYEMKFETPANCEDAIGSQSSHQHGHEEL